MMKLITIPFAGGNKYSFRSIEKHLPGEIKVVNIELPGRGRRVNSKLLYSMEEIVWDLVNEYKHEFVCPYAIYGHSMGAQLTYLLGKEIVALGWTAPSCLVVQGVQVHLPKGRREIYTSFQARLL